MTGGISQPPLTLSRPGVPRSMAADHSKPMASARIAPMTSRVPAIQRATPSGTISVPTRPQPAASTRSPAGSVASIGPAAGLAISSASAFRSPSLCT